MNPVAFIQLFIPGIDPLPGFADHTELLSSSFRFKTHVVLCFCAPDVKKGPGVAGVFNDVPALNGSWALEVAVELPDLLPSIDGKSEAIVHTKDPDGETRRLCLSNRISRFHYLDDGTPYHALAPRTEAWHGAAQVKGAGGDELNAAEEQLRTMAALRFSVLGDTAEHAFESSIKHCLERLFACVNRVLEATRECRRGFTPTTRLLRPEGVRAVYVLLRGEGKAQGARLALNVARIAWNAEVFEAEQATQFRAIADGSTPLDDMDRLIGAAQSSCDDGEYEFAFLQAVIAAEIATARTVRTECSKRGVSKKSLKDCGKEMTYSWALKIGLRLCFSDASRPKDKLIAAMNAARSKRNGLMHEATFNMTHDQVAQLLLDTREYVRALRE